jgi:hypothetical protein
MYMVVSRWEYLPGMKEEFERRGPAVRETIRSQPGVKFAEGFRTEDDGIFAVIAYNSKGDYDRIVNDPDGPFAKALAESKLEDCARWVSSERGETMD